MRRCAVAAWAAIVMTSLASPAAAGAAPVQASWTGAHGAGTFNPSLRCGPGIGGGGDGPNYRYSWTDQTGGASGGVLAGTWHAMFDVHDAEQVDGTNAGTAFVPPGEGVLAIELSGRPGKGYFRAGGGECNSPFLSLSQGPDPFVSGALTVAAERGTGALRGLTGSGVMVLRAQLGPGADNFAQIDLDTNLAVLEPQLSVVGARSYWQNLTAYLNRRLTVELTVKAADAAGDAFAVKIAGVAGGTGSFSGLPTAAKDIAARTTATFAFIMNSAFPGTTYNDLKATIIAKDGLLQTLAPAVSAAPAFKAPVLP